VSVAATLSLGVYNSCEHNKGEVLEGKVRVGSFVLLAMLMFEINCCLLLGVVA